MSLILEALKKSEAKRRLGEAPDIGTPFTTPRRRGSALPLLVLAIVGVGGFGWWYLQKPAARATTTPANIATVPANTAPHAPPAEAKPPTALAATPMKRDIPRPAPLAASHAAPEVVASGDLAARNAAQPAPIKQERNLGPGRPPMTDRFAKWGASPAMGRSLPRDMHRVEKSAAVVKTDDAATPAEPPKAAAPAVAEPKATESPAASAPVLAKAAKTPDMRGLTPAREVKPAATPAADAKTDAAPTANTAVLAKAPKTPDMLGLTPPSPTPAAPAPAADAAATAQTKEDVPFYYELPFSIRKALPPLRLSMHVYAGDPAQRFVILNDSRLTEGDKTADDVTLREVRRDGAVLEFQGQRFFYPRDGM